VRLALLIAILGVGLAPAVGIAQPDHLQLDGRLDERQYLEDQPILAVLCVRNVGPTGFRDLAPLAPTIGYVRVRLVDERGKETSNRTSLRYPASATEGVLLGPGEVQCEQFNLLYEFGDWSPKSPPLARALGQGRLPAGKYRVKFEVQARGAHFKDLLPVRLETPWIEFHVNPAEGNPEYSRLTTDLLAGANWNRNPDHVDEANRNLCRAALPRSYGSPYFYLLFAGAGYTGLDIPPESLLDGMTLAGVPPTRRAAILAFRFEVEPQGDRSKSQWLGRMKKKVKDPLEQDVVSTWETRLQQHRNYHSFGR